MSEKKTKNEKSKGEIERKYRDFGRKNEDKGI